MSPPRAEMALTDITASSVAFSTQKRDRDHVACRSTATSSPGEKRSRSPSPAASPASSPFDSPCSPPLSKRAGSPSPPHLAVPHPAKAAFRTERRSLSLLSSLSETHVKAHETQKSFKRPQFWVLTFGWFLACCAGFVNTVAFISWGAFASHMTGTSTKIGLHIEGYHHNESSMSDMLQACAMVLSFVLGSFTCGVLIDKNQVHFGGKSWYGVALVINSVLLFTATFIPDQSVLSVCLAAMACGLQNAMCTSHFGAVVRTTHVTGTLTDIGSTLGRIAMVYLRKGCRRSRLNVLEKAEVHVDSRKLLVLLPMWISFVLGSSIGAYAENYCGVYAMIIPSTCTLVIGLAYMLLRQILADFFIQLEQQGLRERLMEMHKAFQRTGTRLAEAEVGSGDLNDLDEEMGQMMEALDEVDAGVDNLCRSPTKGNRFGCSPKSHQPLEHEPMEHEPMEHEPMGHEPMGHEPMEQMQSPIQLVAGKV